MLLFHRNRNGHGFLLKLFSTAKVRGNVFLIAIFMLVFVRHASVVTRVSSYISCKNTQSTLDITKHGKLTTVELRIQTWILLTSYAL